MFMQDKYSITSDAEHKTRTASMHICIEQKLTDRSKDVTVIDPLGRLSLFMYIYMQRHRQRSCTTS